MITYTSPKLEAVLTDQIWHRDCYGLRKIPEHPDVMLDIGANVGSCSLFARSLWPETKIVAYEPFPETYELLLKNIKGTPGITAYNLALGQGWEVELLKGADSGSNRAVAAPHTEGKGTIGSLSLQDMVRAQVPQGQTYMIKLDCEGGEWSMWQDPLAIEVLIGAEVVVAELHYQCGKWPEAPTLASAEAWVRSLRRQWEGPTEYHRLGNRAGMLQMRKHDV